MKIFGVCLVFVFISVHAKSQQHLVDSLQEQLRAPMADTSRAVSMMRLAIDYEVIDTAKAYQAYRDAIQFATGKKLYYQLGRIYHNQSYLFSTASREDAAILSIDTAIGCYLKVNTPRSKKWQANAYGDKANYLRSQNDVQESVAYQLKSISLLEELRLQDELVVRYCNVSVVFGDLNELKKQREYAHKAITSAKRGSKQISLQMAYTILAHAYSMSHQAELAKHYLDSARISFNEYSNIDFMFTYYLIAAQVYKKLNELDSSFYYFDQCFKASQKYNYSYGKAESQVEMGALSILKKKYDDAEQHLTVGLAEAEAIHSFNILDDGYRYLSEVYALTGRYQLAYDFYQKYKVASDSILSVESKKNVTSLEKKYESEKKDAQLKMQFIQLQQKNTLNYILVGCAIAILIISLISYRNYRHRQNLQQQRINELETEKQLTATEAVLKGEEQERTRIAKDLHDGLGGMLSGIKYSFNTMKENLIMTPENSRAFERSMDMLDSSIKEMRRVAHNMMPESLVRFGLDTALSDFCNDINHSGALSIRYQSIGLADAQIEQTTAITLYRVVQELINNTLKHAAAKNAIVQVTRAGNVLSATIEDDGKGFNTSILNQAIGMGWSNIQNRVNFLKGKLDINSKPNEGTSVFIEFNI